MGGEIRLLSIFVTLLLLHSCCSFPSEESASSEDDDTQLQQQQNINAESHEEFTKQLKLKGKVEKLQTETVDPCLQEKITSNCKAYIPRIFFNKAEGKCQTFIFGGCGEGKSQNNFKNLAECEKVCAKHLPVPNLAEALAKTNIICTKPPLKPGLIECEAYIPRWTYNSTQGKCVEYIYGGCRASENNFKNKFECEAACGNYDSDSSKIDEQDADQPNPSFKPSVVVPIVSGRERCNLSKDIGFCYAIKERYFFNKRNNRCELFEYGGCGGNSNNFKTANECVRTCGGDAPSENVECSNIECPWELYTHYTTLSCKPIYDGQACCPTRFDCPDKFQELSNNTLGESKSFTFENDSSPEPRCHYQGKLYNIGDEMPDASDVGSCRAACICQGSNYNGKAKIACASIECPEQLGPLPPEKINCLPLYKKGSCCADDFYCPNDTLTIIEADQQAPEEEPIFKCNIDGESYYEGQRFYPKKQKCLKCICAKNFTGDLSDEFCETIDCGIEIYYSDYLDRGCAPVYYQSVDGSTSCCPYSWECPDEVDEHFRGASESPLPIVPVTEATHQAGTSEVGRVPETAPPLVVPTTSTVEIFIPPTQASTLAENKTSHHHNYLLTQESCQLPKEIGSCKGQRLRYFFNKDENLCEEFKYTGCGGNANNFVSIRDCQRLCITSDASESDANNSALARSLDINRQQSQASPRAIYATELDPCTEPKKTGNCKGYFPRYFYSPEDNSCQPFIFGGCRGNGNNFYTKESCEATCTRFMNFQDLRTSVPIRESFGDATRVKFGEDVPSSKSVNGDICTLPKKTGYCKAFVTRYYYDTVEGRCKDFVYGGCRGNENNFRTVKECENTCPSTTASVGTFRIRSEGPPTNDQNSGVIQESKTSVPTWRSSYLEKCHLPPKSGSCLGAHLSYYYNVDTNTCDTFFYSGCFGNANRWTSLSECEVHCKNYEIPSTATTTPIPPKNEGIGGRIAAPLGLPWRQDRIAPLVSESGVDSKLNPTMPLPTPKEAEEVCKLSPSRGPCSAHILRYYWDESTKQCVPFVYSGCGKGNQNNFQSESDCLTVCGKQPTIEKLTSDGVLSCTFGNETLPVGGTVRKFKQNKRWNPDAPLNDQVPCGSTICQCVTPPSVTCFQTACPTAIPTTTQKICPTPSCGYNCQEAVGSDGCPTCDCDETESQVQIEEIFLRDDVKG